MPAATSCETAAATRQRQQAGFGWSAGRRVIQSGGADRAVAVSFAGGTMKRRAADHSRLVLAGPSLRLDEARGGGRAAPVGRSPGRSSLVQDGDGTPDMGAVFMGL